jgi:hemerythrin superfamily protein
VLLKADHREVDKVFRSYEQSGESAHKTRRRLVDEMITRLSEHAFIEEHVLYPAAKHEVPDARDEVLEAVEEHHVVKWELQELVGMDPRDERFNPKVRVLIENVRHHVEEEESAFFPLLRANLGRKRLAELGAELDAIRRDAPRLPHPRMPDGPIDHLVPDTLTNVIDRAKQVVSSVRA